MPAKSSKITVEVLLVGADIDGIKLQPHLIRTRRLLTVDMICPRSATAKIALKEFRNVVQQYTVGISDIASAPIDALAQLEGTYPGPRTVAQGVLDVTEAMMPEAGASVVVEVPLHRPRFARTVGHVRLELRG